MNNPTHYFCLANHSLTAKNGLETAFVKYLVGLSGKLVPADQIGSLQNEIIAKSKALNVEFKRCKPLDISFWKHNSETSYKLSGFYTIGFTIHYAYAEPKLKKYKVPELKSEIYAVDDEDFEAKKAKLLNRDNDYNARSFTTTTQPVNAK